MHCSFCLCCTCLYSKHGYCHSLASAFNFIQQQLQHINCDQVHLQCAMTSQGEGQRVCEMQSSSKPEGGYIVCGVCMFSTSTCAILVLVSSPDIFGVFAYKISPDVNRNNTGQHRTNFVWKTRPAFDYFELHFIYFYTIASLSFTLKCFYHQTASYRWELSTNDAPMHVCSTVYKLRRK